jgi:hypothetical protein
MRQTVIEAWAEADDRDPLPSVNDLCALAGDEPQRTAPGDRFERDQVDIAMYWPEVIPG